jgi:hypothetical protein
MGMGPGLSTETESCDKPGITLMMFSPSVWQIFLFAFTRPCIMLVGRGPRARVLAAGAVADAGTPAPPIGATHHGQHDHVRTS